jgi:hypothetical protein
MENKTANIGLKENSLYYNGTLYFPDGTKKNVSYSINQVFSFNENDNCLFKIKSFTPDFKKTIIDLFINKKGDVVIL